MQNKQVSGMYTLRHHVGTSLFLVHCALGEQILQQQSTNLTHPLSLTLLSPHQDASTGSSEKRLHVDL